MSDPGASNLQRFLDAQAPVLAAVRQELAAGRKRTHWMWFVFPQLAALGRSPTARHFGLADLAEARAYAAHPVLFPRLVDCVTQVLAIPDATAHHVFGTPDDLKFRSCLTLFARAAPAAPIFPAAIARFYGTPDPATLALLEP